MKEKLTEKLNHISFHTPGHNGGVFGEWSKYDITELSYSDNLLSANGIIADLEKSYAKLYQTERAFLFTNGATGAVFASILATQSKIVVLGIAHASVFRAIRAFGKSAVWCRDVATLDKYMADCKAQNIALPGTLFFTAPDYLGNLPDIGAITKFCNDYQLKTICDASHGSHFIFSDKFPVSASKYADLVIHSLHKTLPVLTGGALILCGKQDADSISFARAATHTTSPSYLTLTSFEQPLAFALTSQSAYDEVLSMLSYFTQDLHQNTLFRRILSDDPTRLVILADNAREVQAFLEQNDIFCEYADQTRLVFIVTPFNKNALAHLLQVLRRAPGALQQSVKKANSAEIFNNATAEPLKNATFEPLKSAMLAENTTAESLKSAKMVEITENATAEPLKNATFEPLKSAMLAENTTAESLKSAKMVEITENATAEPLKNTAFESFNSVRLGESATFESLKSAMVAENTTAESLKSAKMVEITEKATAEPLKNTAFESFNSVRLGESATFEPFKSEKATEITKNATDTLSFSASQSVCQTRKAQAQSQVIKTIPLDPYAQCDVSCYELKSVGGVVEKIPLAYAVGKTLAAEVGLYPPGVPLFFAGQVLTQEMIEVLKFYAEILFGLADGCVFVLK